MPLNIPTRKGVSRSLDAYVRTELPSLDPTPERGSKISGWAKSLASALFDWYVALKDYADHEPFPQTARGEFLRNGWWRPLTKLDPIPAAPARGTVAVIGAAGTVIPAGTRFSANGVTFVSEAAVSIVTQPISVASMVFDGTQVIVETTGAHLLATGMSVVVSGASPAQFNGTVTVSVTAENELTYRPTTAPLVGPATGGTILATWAAVTVEADALGRGTNVSSGGTLQLLDTISGVGSSPRATFGGIQGGADAETAEAYRARILAALGTDYGAFTGDEIEQVARTVPGVTRVWVTKATLFGANGVNEGQVRVAFLRDNDADPFPSAQEVADVKRAIVNTCMTAHTAEEDIIVQSPTRRPIDFTFGSITPDTVGMRAAIRAQLGQLFREGVDYGRPVTVDEYRCAIKAAYDSGRRQGLASFALAAPTGDIAVSGTELPVLGAVTFP
jgi:uncharacterized phage protein gp47/JayE